MRLAVTGHRPDKLAGYSEAAEIALINFAEQHIKRINPSEMYIGMALGWDQACAWAAHRLKIPFYACCPFLGFDLRWRERQRFRLSLLLKRAKFTVYVSDTPNEFDTQGVTRAMHRRNLYMVNNAEKVLALWNGSMGGTFDAIQHAHDLNKPVENVWSSYAETEAYRHFQANKQERSASSDEPF